MNSLRIEIPGVPVPKGRPKFRRVGNFVQAYTPAKTQKAEKFIKKCFMEQAANFKMPAKGPISLSIEFFMPIPRGTSQKRKKELINDWHIKRPDLDNLEKLVLDALNGLAWEDDGCISSVVTVKRYAEEPCTVVFIEYL